MRKRVAQALSIAAVAGGLLVATTTLALEVAASDSGELKVRGAPARSLDAFAINGILAKPEAGVREVQIRGVTVDPIQIDVTNIAAGLREVKIEGRTPAGAPFEINREGRELKFEGVNLSPQQIRTILSDPGLKQVKIEGVMIDPNQLNLQNLPAGLREAKIEGTNLAGRPFEIKVKNGVVRQEFGGAMKKGGKGRIGTSSTINNSHARDRGQDLDHGLRGRERAEMERERHGRVEVERHHRLDHNGRVEQRFRVTEPRNGTVITTARGRTEFVGSRGRPEGFISSGHGVRGDSGRSLISVTDRSGHGQSGGHSGHGGEHGR